MLGKDEFVARYAPVMDTRKVVSRKQLCNAVKEACVAFDLPPARFSAKSLRSGFATHMTVCGITREGHEYQCLRRQGGCTSFSFILLDHPML